MNIDLPYGRDRVSLKLPADTAVDYLTPRETSPIDDPEAALAAACADPVDSPTLADLARRSERIVILISDLTRGGGVKILLPLLVKYLKGLETAGASLGVVMARGTHRKLDKEEKQFFRRGYLKGVSFEEHDCDDPAGLKALVLTSRKTPVRINRRLKEADLVIILSSISFHYFAGFGGGRKLVLPGVADRASIIANHRLSLVASVPVRLNPLCRSGVLEGNPVHEDMCEALRALDRVFAVNFFTDTSGRLVFVNGGEPESSHLAACEVYADAFTRPVSGLYDVVVAGAGGYPYDMNLLQSHKALRNAAGGTRKGGSILLFAECAEGVGSRALEEALERPRDEFLREAYENYRLNNQTAVSINSLAADYRIGMVTVLGAEWLERAGIEYCENPEA